MKVTRRYNAMFNSEAIADILYANMKVLGAIESIADMYEDGEELDAETINHIEERVALLQLSIIKIWSYPLDKSKEFGGELEGEGERPERSESLSGK